MSQQFIPLSVPNFSGNEKQYVNEAVISEWVSTGGSKVSEFEEKIAEYTHMPRAVACNSGTSGLHLAMLMAGGEWLAANTEQRDGKCVNRHTGAHVKALLAVHVFGNMANMPGLVELCRKYGLVLIEDSTEALGTYYTEGPYRGKMAGTIGDIGVYSFNGNKIITTGAGGMVVSNHADWLERAKHLSTQAKADELQFVHDEVGYNYRLTNLQAALGLAQLEQLEGFIAHKNEMYDFYKERLDGKNGYRILPFRDGVRSNKWFYSLYLEDARHTRDGVIAALKAQNIQTRPVWALIHEQADYGRNETYGLAMAEDFRAKIVNLPCSTNLTREDAQRVVDALLAL